MPDSLGERDIKRIRIDALPFDSPILSSRPNQVAEPELYDPTIVRISVEYKGEGEVYSAADSLPERFSVPRYLICSESPVFKKRFAVRTATRIINVRPWAFRVFIRWLHKGDIYYDSKRMEPNSCHHPGQAESSELDISDEECIIGFEVAEMTEKGRVDYREPVTWPYSWLFELYIFALEYEIELFRSDIQDTIHVKLIEERCLPEPAELAGVVKKLSDQDTLYFLLAHWHSETNTRCAGKAKLEVVEKFSILPSRLLCLSRSMRDARHAAENCSICGQGSTDKKCNAPDHLKEDAISPHLEPPWVYHYRHTPGKGPRCYWRWMSRMYRICTIEFTNGVEA